MYKFGIPKPYRLLKSRPELGSFATESNPYRWDVCRETFASKFKEDTLGLYYCHPPKRSDDMAEFIAKTEQILKINDPTVCELTTDDEVMLISPSSFWRACRMRRSLFTLLLRTADNYDFSLDNYEEALFALKEMKHTRGAVLRFMFGFTKYTEKRLALVHPCGYKYGWHLAFGKKNKKQIRQFLKRPDKHKICLAGVNDFCT